jgi:hypothetical protein
MNRYEAMVKPSTPQPQQPLAALAKGQFRCFRCRKVYMMKDGDWHHWQSMEVHLCRGCDKDTRNAPERAR